MGFQGLGFEGSRFEGFGLRVKGQGSRVDIGDI